MKTEDLISVLADSAVAVDRRATGRRFIVPLAAALVVSVAAMWAFFGPRPDWREAIGIPMFWLKLEFTAAAVVAGAFLLRRSGEPGRRVGGAVAVAALPFVLLWLIALIVLVQAPEGTRSSLVLGTTWLQCLASIPALSLPALVLSFLAIRSLAPTHLMLAGGAAGLVAGSVAAFAYAVHCTEMQAPFLAVWYVIGMLVPAFAGALLGPRLLRW
jgi:hypothetical protein